MSFNRDAPYEIFVDHPTTVSPNMSMHGEQKLERTLVAELEVCVRYRRRAATS